MNDLSRRYLPGADTGEPPPRPRGLRAGPFGVLDIGTTKVVCLIGRTDADGSLRVMGFGWQKSAGVRGGNITDIRQAVQVIRAAVGQAEDMADTRLRAVTVNLSCGQPESRLFNVQFQIGGRVITDADVRRVVTEGRNRAGVDAREIIHSLPLGFSVDETAGVPDPRGLHCEDLTARLHVIDAGTTALRNLAATIGQCDLEIAELVSAPLAAGLATLVEDEREMGATVIDMGGGTTSLAVFCDGQVLHTSTLAMGGVHVTGDIARGLVTPLAHAERVKTLYGHAHASPDDARNPLPMPLVGEPEDQHVSVPQSMVVSIIRPRLEEIFELVRDRLNGSGVGRAAGSRVVLTGGACQLNGTQELAARILDRQVRVGRPVFLRDLPDMQTNYGFAAAAGLLAWSAGYGRPMHDLDLQQDQPMGRLGRLIAFLRDRM